MTLSVIEETYCKPYRFFTELQKREIRRWAASICDEIAKLGEAEQEGYLLPALNRSKAKLLMAQLKEALPKEMVE